MNNRFLLVCLLLAAIFPSQKSWSAEPLRSGPAIELEQLYQQNPAFRATIEMMFRNLKDGQDGKENFWKGRGFTDLLDFVDLWCQFLPTVSNGLEFIRKFQMLYFENEYGLTFVQQEPGLSWTRKLSLARRDFMDSPASAAILPQWMNEPAIHIQDYQIPDQGFQTFNEFFIRSLKAGARPIWRADDPAVVVSPADSLLEIFEVDLKLSSEIPLKGSVTLRVDELLDMAPHAAKFVGGTVVRCILEPTSYHHYHAPVGGRIIQAREDVPGVYYDTRQITAAERYHRGYFIFETEKFGLVAMVPVGLATISSVVFEEPFKRVDPAAPQAVEKGQRLGHFAYGGSMVILLFEPGRFPSLSAAQGQQIGILE